MPRKYNSVVNSPNTRGVSSNARGPVDTLRNVGDRLSNIVKLSAFFESSRISLNMKYETTIIQASIKGLNTLSYFIIFCVGTNERI